MGKQAVQQNPEAPKTELPVSKETTDMARVSSEATNGSWFTPIRGALNLSNFQDGFLSSAFMIGLIVASPIFASLVKSYNPFRLIGVGLTVWTFAIAGSGFPIDFWFIIACRVLVGVGIAPFVSIGAPYIDDIAPVAQVGNNLGWRYAFFGLAIVMCPFAVIGFLAKPLKLKGCSPAESKKASTSVSEAKGNIAYNFVLGAYSYWGPKAGYGIYHMKNADMIFGGVTMVCGIVGTLSGGFVLDRMTSTISNAFKGPVNFICLQCVQPSMRPISMAMSVVAIHVFGDVPSAPLVGVLQDYLNNWRKTTLILTSILFLAAIIWFIGIFLYKGGKSNGDCEKQVAIVSKSNETPLVDEMAIESTNSSLAKPMINSSL
ncbi:hypothetical protein RHMOL_Rhmol06G0268400 [Rhododendron molle]|uniref:Uncharacterized protein n=1 Tax=Rhododendron molle TaxID=49168 RepID=A0ACC0NGY4_RHOML|nr:hypothetical protein RHMOL_Rhmol06G0268400 [Rhododendron molle]